MAPAMERLSMSALDILIVGAGISGLAAAYSLGKTGHRVTVLESASALSEIGAGIQVGPNMSRILTKWGLRDRLDKLAVKPGGISLFRYESGDKVGYAPFGSYLEKEYGAPYYHVHRADLLSMLYDLAAPYMTLHLNSQVKQIHLPDKSEPSSSSARPRLTLRSGRTFSADLIIGADGVHSIVRDAISGFTYNEQGTIRANEVPTGDAAYRVLIPTEKLMADPELSTFVENPEYSCWMGPNRHIVGYCIKQKQQYNLVFIHPHSGHDVSIPASDYLRHVKDLFEGWEPRVQKLLALITPESLTKTVLNVQRPVDEWVDSSGRVVLIGDACHTMLPYRAQGSAMAVEDVVVLSTLLSKLASTSPAKLNASLPTLLKAFQSIRQPRVARVQADSWSNRGIFHLPDGEEQKTRDDSMRSAMLHGDGNNFGCSNLFADKSSNDELFGHDVNQVADRWLANNLNHTPDSDWCPPKIEFHDLPEATKLSAVMMKDHGPTPSYFALLRNNISRCCTVIFRPVLDCVSVH